LVGRRTPGGAGPIAGEGAVEQAAPSERSPQEMGIGEATEHKLFTEERVRRRVAVRLHGGVAQTLALARVKLGALRKEAASEGSSRALDELCGLVDRALLEVRGLSSEMSPHVLYELGLEAATRQLVEEFGERHGISVRYDDDGQLKPQEDDVRTLLFQATRELLANVAEHAGARNVKVSTRVGRLGNLEVVVKDDGVGFDTSEIGIRMDGTGGDGLFSIRERLHHVGGELSIVSEPGFGTSAALAAPSVSGPPTSRSRFSADASGG